MKSFAFIVFVLSGISTFAQQLPGKIQKMEGLWQFKEGSGFEKWEVNGDVLSGASFRISKLGDTIIAEQMEIKSINNRLVLHIEAYNIIDDSLQITRRDFIGKKRKAEFTSISNISTTSLTYKSKFLSRKKMYLIIQSAGIEKPRKLILFRQD